VTLNAPDPPLGDGVVTLRPPEERDLDAIDQGSRDRDVSRWVGRPEGSAPEILALNRRRWAAGSPTFAICDVDDACVGHVWINLSATDAATGSVGYWLLPASRGRGLATRAVRLLVPWARRAMGLGQIRLVTQSANQRAQAVAARSGFRVVGTVSRPSEVDGRTVDFTVFAWSAEDTNPR
jgi:RimJ/RimL family protein N-acetyltransferase